MKNLSLVLVATLALTFALSACTPGGSGEGSGDPLEVKGTYTILSSSCDFAEADSTFYVDEDGSLSPSASGGALPNADIMTVETAGPKEKTDSLVEVGNVDILDGEITEESALTEPKNVIDTKVSNISGSFSVTASGDVAASVTVDEVVYNCSGDLADEIIALSCATTGSTESCTLTAERYVPQPGQIYTE